MEAELGFSRIVSQIFTNWTALRLAVEHSRKGSEAAQEFIDYMVKYVLYQPNVCLSEVEEALEDILDEEFEAVAADGSPREIATYLMKFADLIKQNRLAECEEEFSKLPVIDSNWLSTVTRRTTQESDSSSSDDDEVTNTGSDQPSQSEAPMDPDGWVEVKGRRKR